MLLRRLVAHSLIYTIAPQVPRVASLLLMPIITRHAGTTDYGVYGLITSYLLLAGALKDLGLGVVFANVYFRHPQRWPIIWRMLFGHLVLWSFAFAGLLLAILFLAVPSSSTSHFLEIALLVIVPALAFDGVATLGNYYFRFSERPMYIGIATAVAGVAAVLTTYFGIVRFDLGYLAWFLASFVSSLVLFLFYFHPVVIRLRLLPVLQIRRRFIVPHLRTALPLIPHNYSTYLLNSSDRVILNLFDVGIEQIGRYNFAYLFGNYCESAGEAVGMAVSPTYMKLYTSHDPRAAAGARAFTFLLMVAFLTGTFTLALWLKEIFLILVADPDLRSSYAIGTIIVMGYSFRPMYWCVGLRLTASGLTSSLWRLSFLGGLLNVVLNLAFVAHWGIQAAAINTMLALMFVGFAGFYFRTFRAATPVEHYPMAWMAAISILTATAYLMRDSAIAAKSVVTLIELIAAGSLAWGQLRHIRGAMNVS